MTDKYVSELPKCKLCDNYPVNYHTGAFGVKHHCADKHCTLHNVLFTEEQWRTLMGEPEPASSVPMPKNADQSELMVKAGMMWLEENAPERLKPASAEPVAASINDISNDAAELNRLKCALQDETVASGVMLAFWRRVFGSANMSLFDKQSMTAHMLTALSGVEVFSRNELADVECPDCGPVSVTPDVYNAGIPIGGECPYCHDRLCFYQQPPEDA